MHAAVLVSSLYSALAAAVLFLHALFILWVVFGALLTRSRSILRWLHIASVVWGILTELLPWPCPLTLLADWLEGRAGIEPYQGAFLQFVTLDEELHIWYGGLQPVSWTREARVGPG